MRLYVEVARRTCARVATYRMATVAGAFTNTVFGFILGYVLLAVYRQRDDVGGFDAVDALTFTFVSQGLLMVMGMFGDLEMAERVRTGDIAVDLQRPYDQQAWWAAVAYGKAAYHIVFRGVPPFLVGALAFDLRLVEPTDVAPFVLSVTLGVGVAFGWRYLISLSAFWLLDVRGPNQLGWLLALFLSGAMVPVVFFPAWLETLARVLPFTSMVQLPIEVWLGHHVGLDLLGALAVQAAWLFALAALGRVLFGRAVRRVVVQGG